MTQLRIDAIAPAGRPAESLANPQVGAALTDERTAGLGEDKSVGHEKEDGEDERPGEGLCAEACRLGEDFDAEHGRHDDEHDVETAERLLQMLFLLVRVCGGLFV